MFHRIEKIPLHPAEAKTVRQVCIRYAELAFPSQTVRRFRALAESNQSQVYYVELDYKLRIVLKRHFYRESFARELFALRMYEGLGSVPRLCAPVAFDLNLLVIEYIPRPYIFHSLIDFAAAAHMLGRLHGFANLCVRQLYASTGQCYPSLGDLARDVALPTFQIVRRMIDVFGPTYNPISIGDIKPEHIRRRGRECILVDLETFRWGGLELIDLAQLLAIPIPSDRRVVRRRYVCEHYCQGRNEVQEWAVDPSTLMEWLTFVA